MKQPLLLLLLIITSSPLFSTEKIVIIGSGPAGYTAAIYAGRAGLSPLVIEGSTPGGLITMAGKIENYPGLPHPISGVELIKNMHNQAKSFGARFTSDTVSAIDISQRPFKIFLNDRRIIECHTMIIAAGTSHRWLGLRSEAALRGRGVNTCALCDGIFFKDQKVVVVGGGDQALSDALILSNIAEHVTLIHRHDSLKAAEDLQHHVAQKDNITIKYHTMVEDILDPEIGKVTGVSLHDLKKNNHYFMPCDGVFVAIGNKPNTDPFKKHIACDDQGYIIVQPYSTQTSVPGVYAAGNISRQDFHQTVTAAGDGCRAALEAKNYLSKHHP
ncbi:MAG: thioredoxin-disulfide reductase [Chlamydiota bacterium]